MKIRHCLVCLASLVLSSSIFAQGSLEPEDPPGPTMKTLQQVEPRTPISQAMIIENPGSYYLTNNIEGIVSIEANGVDLDLNGFSIVNSPSTGILVDIVSGARISNGKIVNAVGPAIGGTGTGNIQIEDISATNNGQCVSMVSPTGLVEVRRLNCDTTIGAGVNVTRANAGDLNAVVLDSTFTNVNTDNKTIQAAIRIVHEGTGMTTAVVMNNRVVNSNTNGIAVVSDLGGDSRGGGGGEEGASAGSIIGNIVHRSGSVGLTVIGEFVVAKNISSGNLINYSLGSAPNVASVTGVSSVPGPGAWDNISDEFLKP